MTTKIEFRTNNERGTLCFFEGEMVVGILEVCGSRLRTFLGVDSKRVVNVEPVHGVSAAGFGSLLAMSDDRGVEIIENGRFADRLRFYLGEEEGGRIAAAIANGEF